MLAKENKMNKTVLEKGLLMVKLLIDKSKNTNSNRCWWWNDHDYS